MNRKLMLFIGLMICCYTMFAAIIEVEDMEKSPEFLEISVIVRTREQGQWAGIRQGIERASDDWGAEIRFITLEETANAQQQMTLLNREIERGADAVLISAADSEALVPAVDEALKHVPVVAFESPVNSKSLTEYLSCDDGAMGRELAAEIARTAPEGAITVLGSSGASSAMRIRRDSITHALTAQGFEVRIHQLSEDTALAQTELEGLISGDTKTMVSLETPVLEATVRAARAAKSNTVIYGIGSGDFVAASLSQGAIRGLIATNDFSTGYLALKTAVQAVRGEKHVKPEAQDFRLVTRQNMYDPDIEKLLFPFVK